MVPTDASMAALAEALPFPDALDNVARFGRLAERLRETAVGKAGANVFELAADALTALPLEPQTSDRAMCWALIARQRYLGAMPFAALDAATVASGIATHVGDDSLSAKTLKLLGLIYAETGNYPAATAALLRALEAARGAGDRIQEAEIFTNLGVTHFYAGQFGTAVPCYERAAAIATAAGAPTITRATPLGNSALACLYLRDLTKGLTAAEQAIDLLDKPQDNAEANARAMTEFVYTRLLLEARNLPLAAERAKLARSFAQGAGDRATMFAEMAQGLSEAHTRASRDIGLSRLEEVVSKAREGVHSVLRDALSTIVEAYRVADQPNEALVYQREVLQFNRESRVRDLLEHHQRHLVEVKKSLDERAQAALSLQREELEFQRFSIEDFSEFTQVLEVNTVAVELHDDDTGQHCYRVGALARELARKFGMDNDECRLIDYSARLHDIGKIRLPHDLLFVPRKFTDEERRLMQQHCEFGREIISESGLGQLFLAKEIAWNHHERWDGSGYPRGIQGEMIPLVARIVAIVDVYDALVHRRCYKPAWTIEDALAEINKPNSKTGQLVFDPQLVGLFNELIPELRATHGDLDAYLAAEAGKNDLIINRAKLARELADQHS